MQSHFRLREKMGAESSTGWWRQEERRLKHTDGKLSGERGSRQRDPCGRSCKQRTSQKDRRSGPQDETPGRDCRISGPLREGKRTGGWEGGSRAHGLQRFRFTRKDSSQPLYRTNLLEHLSPASICSVVGMMCMHGGFFCFVFCFGLGCFLTSSI